MAPATSPSSFRAFPRFEYASAKLGSIRMHCCTNKVMARESIGKRRCFGKNDHITTDERRDREHFDRSVVV